MHINELRTHGRVYVEYPKELRAAVADAVRAWEVFCALPEEMKLRFSYEPDTVVSGNGYELKRGTTFDLKENFHIRPAVEARMFELAEQVGDSAATAFVEKALALADPIEPVIRDFARKVEETYGISGFEKDALATKAQWLIRFIHYFEGRLPGEELAAAHTDKGGYTLHLYENSPGVERLTYEKEWVPMDLPEGQTVIFPATGLQNRSKCELKATCHRVVATEESSKNGRYAAVAFFGFENERFFDKKRFGAQQVWAPGAFYDMSYGEFDKLFID